MTSSPESLRQRPKPAKTVDEAARRAAHALDDCTHPECVMARKTNGYSYCAGGHLARRVVNAIYGRTK